MAKLSDFIRRQREAHAEFFGRTAPPEALRSGEAWRFAREHRDLNLAPTVREALVKYFGPPRNIERHLHASHGLSSQVCCLNFLAPLATQPELLARIVGAALGITGPRMLPVEEGPDGKPWFVGFEWTGLADYLGEWASGSATRGKYATSADAIVRFEAEGRTETLLIEWKYTEQYGGPIDPEGNETRIARYTGKTFAPEGPIRGDLDLKIEDFFWEPFYQLLRQQMLAWRMERARETGTERVRVLHISPGGNRDLHKVTAPSLREFGADAFEVFRSLLVDPDSFVSKSIEDVFGAAIRDAHDAEIAERWAGYLRERYSCILDASTTQPAKAASARTAILSRTLRIGTWNVEYAYPNRLEALRRVLRENPADIWVLTETHDDLAPPGCSFVVHSEPRPKNWSGIREGSRWVSIWSHQPIQRAIALPGADLERTVVAEIELSPSETMLVYGTVMPWKGDRGKFDWSEHRRIVPQQCAEWRVLCEQFPDASLCVAGDFNTDMGTGSYYGTREGIAALRDGLAQSDLFCATEPGRMPSGLLPYPPIDHIALPQSWRDRIAVVAAWPADRKVLSDHSGLVVEIAPTPTR